MPREIYTLIFLFKSQLLYAYCIFPYLSPMPDLLQIVQPIIHYGLHFLLPLAVARIFYKDRWGRVYVIFILTMLVDLDHLLADPVFQANRCSIGFHPLHSYIAIGIYVLMLLHPKLRVVALGLLMHMAADGIDCIVTYQT